MFAMYLLLIIKRLNDCPDKAGKRSKLTGEVELNRLSKYDFNAKLKGIA
jgi:hypothetical protein